MKILFGYAYFNYHYTSNSGVNWGLSGRPFEVYNIQAYDKLQRGRITFPYSFKAFINEVTQ